MGSRFRRMSRSRFSFGMSHRKVPAEQAVKSKLKELSLARTCRAMDECTDSDTIRDSMSEKGTEHGAAGRSESAGAGAAYCGPFATAFLAWFGQK